MERRLRPGYACGMRYLIILLTVLLLTPAVMAGAYKWVDKDGNVHYSDTPVDGAEPVQLPPPATYEAPQLPPRQRAEPGEQAKDDTKADFAQLAFVSPRQDQVFWATGGDIPVYVSIKPGLLPDHRLNLYFNGVLTKNSPLPGPGTTLTGVQRGAHTLRAVILDASGEQLAASETVTFHVKQRSILNPQRKKPAAK